MPASADDGHNRGHHHQAYSKVVLGDIQYNSPGRDDYSNRSLNGEWVEVTNTGRRAVNLDGWTLSDRSGNRYRFEDLRLAGRATVRVHTGYGRDTRTDVYQDSRDYIWSNYSDRATLRNDRGWTVDTESWGRDRDHRNGYDRGHRR
ncbi:lamin tail domain-containing protein [Streptomyces sp. NPDC005181]|uniref:lamin tail domain-containing protein n=1 Tax=Streptomyces sp. NPDC005181 TaxID=3156869 RepID=UPI0033A48B24